MTPDPSQKRSAEVTYSHAQVRHPLQQCAHFVPGLRSMPWWDPDEFPATALLEDNFEAIRSEFFNLLLCGHLKLHPQSKGGPRKQIADGNWGMFELLSRGRVNAENAVQAPHTIRTLMMLPEVSTNPSALAYFSVLSPHVHIAPHCGPTNSRIRIHLGLRVPKGAAMRVGYERRSWKEGLCTVFDDSWEHEVFNSSRFLRAVLLIDVWHPDLTMQQRSEITSLRSSRRRNDEKRRKERNGWFDGTRLKSTFAGPALHDLIGSTHLSRMISSVSRARTSRYQVFRALHTFASASLIATRAGTVIRPADDGADVCRGLWSSLASLVSEQPTALSTEDVINIIHIGCAYWRSLAGNEELMCRFMEGWAIGPKALLFEAPRHLNGIHEVLHWCDVHQKKFGIFGVVASAAVTAIQEMSH
jgi:aspartyl/asparaginyl beta-hydroxylase (cupin superfamily)